MSLVPSREIVNWAMPWPVAAHVSSTSTGEPADAVNEVIFGPAGLVGTGVFDPPLSASATATPQTRSTMRTAAIIIPLRLAARSGDAGGGGGARGGVDGPAAGASSMTSSVA